MRLSMPDPRSMRQVPQVVRSQRVEGHLEDDGYYVEDTGPIRQVVRPHRLEAQPILEDDAYYVDDGGPVYAERLPPRGRAYDMDDLEDMEDRRYYTSRDYPVVRAPDVVPASRMDYVEVPPAQWVGRSTPEVAYVSGRHSPVRPEPVQVHTGRASPTRRPPAVDKELLRKQQEQITNLQAESKNLRQQLQAARTKTNNNGRDVSELQRLKRRMGYLEQENRELRQRCHQQQSHTDDESRRSPVRGLTSPRSDHHSRQAGALVVYNSHGGRSSPTRSRSRSEPLHQSRHHTSAHRTDDPVRQRERGWGSNRGGNRNAAPRKNKKFDHVKPRVYKDLNTTKREDEKQELRSATNSPTKGYPNRVYYEVPHAQEAPPIVVPSAREVIPASQYYPVSSGRVLGEHRRVVGERAYLEGDYVDGPVVTEYPAWYGTTARGVSNLGEPIRVYETERF